MTSSAAATSPPPSLAVDVPPSDFMAPFVSNGHRFIFRRLVPTDQSDIAELARHTYEGRDWIVHDFDNWMNCTVEQLLTVAIVYSGPASGEAEVDGECAAVMAERSQYVGRVIAIEVSKLLDGGSTSWLCALRVHPNFRGLHLSSRLHSYLIAVSQQRPTVRRLRESSHRNNTVSLYLAAKVHMKVVYESGFSWVHREQHDSRLAWVERQLIKRGAQLADVRLREDSTDGSGWLSRSRGDDLLALHAANKSHPAFHCLLQYWFCYEFTADNVCMLTEEPDSAHEVVISHSSPAAADSDVQAVTLLQSRADFSSTIQAFTIYATSATHCLLHLHHALQRQTPHRHDQDKYAPSSVFVPRFFHEEVNDDADEQQQQDAWRAEQTFVLLERQIEHLTAVI